MKTDKKNTNLNWLEKARESWDHTGVERPTFAVRPKKGQRSVWDFPRPPLLERTFKTLTINYKGEKIADTRNALAVLETASPPTYYIPKRDIDMNALVRIKDKTSMCEWKGKALYWALKGMTNRAVAWSYPRPFQEFEDIKDFVAFYPHYLECYVDGERVVAQNSEFYAGWITSDLVGPFKGEKGTEHW